MARHGQVVTAIVLQLFSNTFHAYRSDEGGVYGFDKSEEGTTWCRDNPAALTAFRAALALL